MREIEMPCPACRAPIELSLSSFAPLQFGSKRIDFYCDGCNKPSFLNLQSQLASNFTLLIFMAIAVFLAISLNVQHKDVAQAAILVLVPLSGFAAACWVGSLMPTLVNSKNGT